MYRHKITTAIGQNQPISAPKLLEILKKDHPSLNKTTIYRQLEKLIKEGSVTELALGNDYKSYELASNHHHIVCTSCKKAECLPEPCNIDHPKTNFKIISHNLEFYGLCPTCQTQ